LNVIACASTDEKLQRVRELAVDFTINYAREDFAPLVKEHTSGRGTDIVIESVGGDFVRKSLSCMAPFGRMVIIGRSSGPSPPIDTVELFQNCVSISGFWLMALAAQQALLASIVKQLLDVVQRSNIRPVIGGIYTFEQAGDAIRALESRTTYGKLVLRPS
jgi:NADPH2:quinone reductase